MSIRWSVLLFSLVAVMAPRASYGQEWSVDLSAGQIVYDPVATHVDTNNATATLRYDSRLGIWVYGTAATPLRGGDIMWGASGTGGRFLSPGWQRHRASLGADVGVHGFLFRDAVVDQAGRGSTIDAIPFLRVAAGTGSLELRGGWRGQVLSYAGAVERRGVFETGIRGSYGVTARVEGNARWVRASEGTYPFLGGTLTYGGLPVQAWVQLGKWQSAVLHDVSWGGGVGAAIGPQTTVWTSLRQEASDPLYWNVTRRSWNVGVTRRFGGAARAVSLPTRQDSGGVVVRLPVADAPDAAVSIAGDFNNWQPVPLRREGHEWVIRLPLPPGAYHYAFRSGQGDWFVPASVPSRRSDGMGGYIAVLVVS